MRALQIEQFGEPADALKIVDVKMPPLRQGEVRVRIQAAGINPSDVANAKGAFPSTTPPRIGPSLVSALADGGRMAVYSASFGGREMQLDLFDFYRRRLEIIGVSTGVIDAARAAAILEELRPLFDKGLIDRPRIAERYLLDAFAKAYDRVRASVGKVVFVFGSK